MHPTCLIDGFGPLPLHPTQSVDDLCQLVQQAQANDQAVYPIGGGTLLCLGDRPHAAGFAVDLRGLDQVIDYPARDMTITVQAGMTVAALQAILQPENQQLPIDVPSAESATVGGILAANVSGSRRYGYGTLRDYLLGMSAVNDQGQEIKAGGRVVKNVAGYDLGKLFIGSLGTLGIITQATLKLRPLPENQALVSLACTQGQLDELLRQLHDSQTRPMALDLLNQRATRWLHEHAGSQPPGSSWSVIVGYDGNAEAVKWQVQQLVKELRSRYTLEAYVNGAAQPFWNALAQFGAVPGDAAGTLVFKASVLPSQTAEFCRAAENLGGMMLKAHAGNGIITGQVFDLTREDAAAQVDKLRSAAREQRGTLIVAACPPDWKDVLSVWGPPPENAWLMRKVKESLDPNRRFNPGRFIAGI